MEKKLAEILSGHIVSSSKELNIIIKQLREELLEHEFNTYMKKLSHIMALNFDVLDIIGEKHPELNPYENNDNNKGIKNKEPNSLRLIRSNNNTDDNDS